MVLPKRGDGGQQRGDGGEAEDLHTWVEARLTALAGDAGRKIHTARSRNDQVATLLRMFCIDAATQLAAQLAAFAQRACERASAWADLAFPLMTHQQFAAPGSVGFWMLRYAVAADRVRRRLHADAVEWRRECPLGSGAVAGSSIAIDRTIQAHELGFDGPSLCALDSTTTRDDCLGLLATLTQLGLHLQSFATDVIVFSQTPVAWTAYPAAFGTGSSMMPNKRNPDAMELLRGESCGLAAAHGQMVLLLKGLPSGYNRDLQCVKPVVRDAVVQASRLVEMLAAFIGELEFDAERLTAALAQGHINATLRMEELVRAGKPLRQAHHQVADEVTSAKSGAEPAITDSLNRYATFGSTNPDEVRRIAEALRAALA